MGIQDLREDLEDKHARGVKQVRVTTMLAALPESLEQAFPAQHLLLKEAADAAQAAADARITDAQRRVETLTAELAEATKAVKRRRVVTSPRAAADDDLLGTAEAAEVLGVERPRIGKWRALDKMPAPVAELAAGPVWERWQIEGMVEATESRRRSTRRTDGVTD